MLMEKSFLQETCEIISGLFNVVITIVDEEFIRIAGTDHYKDQIGKPAANPNVFKDVMDNDKTVIIRNPGEESVCAFCKNRMLCREKAAIYAPLKVNDKMAGGIGIMAFTEEQKSSVFFKNEGFQKFTEKLAELISGKIEADEYLNMLSVNLKKNLIIINSVHDGVIAVNENGMIYQINRSALTMLGGSTEQYVGQPLTKVLSRRTSERIKHDKNFVDEDDKIGLGNSKIPVLLSAHTIENEGGLYGTVLTFKTVKEANSLAQRMLRDDDYKISFDDIVGDSVEIENAKDFARKVAGSNSTVLIRGESGTGKEMFARAIHNSSSRKNGPFVAINCAAIPEPLLESELFGYEDGAFTGARHGGKMGKCELAIGGTLFLDEVGDIPLFLQSKFLRMLQERCIERVGGNKRIHVDIRIIAATNKNLEEMIENNEFREDLYYRLNVIPVFLPPLRKRKEDIVTVGKHFLRKYTAKLGKDIEDIAPDALAIMRDYDWPGNLRELENAIECAVNVETGNLLTAASLPEKVREKTGIKNVRTTYDTSYEKTPEEENGAKLKERRRKTELDTVINALDKYGWDTKGKKNAAKSLGIGIATLYRILNK